MDIIIENLENNIPGLIPTVTVHVIINSFLINNI